MSATSGKAPRANLRPLLTLLILAAFGASLASHFAGPAAAQDVMWTNGVHVTITGSSVQKTGGTDGVFDAEATSQQLIEDNGGADWYVEFTVPLANPYFFHISLESGATTQSDVLMQFRRNGVFVIYDPAATPDRSHADGDVFRIARVSGVLTFSQNGAVVHTAPSAPFYYPLRLKFGARESNSMVTNATIVNDARLPLGAPRNLSAAAVSATQINLMWADRADAETGFRVERRPGDTGQWAEIGTALPDATFYSDTSVPAEPKNVPYAYRVRAVSGANSGPYSTTASATVAPSPLGSVKEDKLVRPEGPLPVKPLAGGYVYDPVFGAKLMRVTDASDGSVNAGTEYSYWPTFNANNTRILAQVQQPDGSAAPPAALYEFDPVNFRLGARSYPRPLPGGGRPSFAWAIWSNTDPDVFYAADTSGGLWAYDVGDRYWTLIADFDSPNVVNPLPAGHYGWQMQMSADEEMFSFNESRNPPGGGNAVQVGYFAYRRSTNTIVKRVAQPDINEAHIDKSGRYLFALIDLPERTDLTREQLEARVEGFVWDLHSGGPVVELTDGVPDLNPGHHDVGYDLIVGNTNWENGPMNKRSLSAPHSPSVVFSPIPPSTYGHGMDHHSMLADNQQWVFGSNYTDPAIQSAFGKELFQVKLDGSQSVRRLAHHYCLYDGTYIKSPRANISRDGKFAAFSSNWNAVNGRRDLFIAKFEPAPGSPPAPPSRLRIRSINVLFWDDNSTNEDGFKIERLSSSDGSWREFAQVGPNVETYKVGGTCNDTRYRVRAFNAYGFSLTTPDTRCFDVFPSEGGVEWTDRVYATAGFGGAIKKTPTGSDWPPGSANSVQSIDGDGHFDAFVNHNGAPNLYVIDTGLNSGSLSTVEYYWAISNAYAMPYVNGAYKASTPVTTSDRLRIAVESGVVKFYKNAELIYTSDVAPSFPLKAYFGSPFDNVGLSSSDIQSSSAAAAWTDLIKSTTGPGGSIVKTTGSGDWPPASANTVQALAGSGSFEFVLNNNGSPNLYPMNVGLNSGDLTALEYYWAISSGYAMPYVNNAYKASTPVTTSDRLKIVVDAGVVKFYKNAELIYTSDVAPAFPLKGYFGSMFDGVGLTSASFVGGS